MSRTRFVVTGERLATVKTSVLIFHDRQALELMVHSNIGHKNETLIEKNENSWDRGNPFEIVDDVINLCKVIVSVSISVNRD
jgi:hypothetical protein